MTSFSSLAGRPSRLQAVPGEDWGADLRGRTLVRTREQTYSRLQAVPGEDWGADQLAATGGRYPRSRKLMEASTSEVDLPILETKKIDVRLSACLPEDSFLGEGLFGFDRMNLLSWIIEVDFVGLGAFEIFLIVYFNLNILWYF